MQEMKTVIGLYSKEDDAKTALMELQLQGYAAKNISLVMTDRRDAEKMRRKVGEKVGTHADHGAQTGTMVGGVTGLLMGMSAFVLPGVGAFLVSGPLAMALGLTGIAATTATCAVAGGFAGGLIGALTNLGLKQAEAEKYQEQIKEGAILLAVPVKPERINIVANILKRYHATDVKFLKLEKEQKTASAAFGLT